MQKKAAYESAIEAEIRAQNLYRALAKSFRNPQSAQVFHQLIIFEEFHEEQLRDLFEKDFPGEQPAVNVNIAPRLEGIKLEDPKAVLEFAITEEEKAHDVYQNLADQCEDAETKAMLMDLAREEENHKEVLYTEIERLQGSQQWYDPSELAGYMEGG